MNFRTVLTIGLCALISAPALAKSKKSHKHVAIAIAKMQQNNTPTRVVVWDIDDVLYTKKTGPNEDAFKIVKDLKERGVKQVLFSNKPEKEYLKLKKTHPAYFNAGYFDESLSLVKPKLFERKPHHKYIHKFIAKHNKKNLHNMVFFDDKRDNVISANEHGIKGLLFTDAAKARKQLEKIGILA